MSSRFSMLMTILTCGAIVSSPALAASVPTNEVSDKTPTTLLSAWLTWPSADNVQWPYAYIVARGTASQGKGSRSDLFDEFDRLHWRLVNLGYPKLADTVEEWRAELKRTTTYRTPGNWSPAFLLAHPNHQPPIDQIAAIGVCHVPKTVGVWSSAGYLALPWRSNMRLSDIEKQVPSVRQGSQAEIAVVDPYGHIDHYGVQAWNYEDGFVAPGTQIIASLPLKGEAFGWIQDSMAELLAHRPSGVDCRRETISSGESTRG